MRFMWLWLFIALLIAGCASRYTARPQIALVDLRLGEVTLLETDQFRYKISGHVYIGGGFGADKRIPIEHIGSLNLK